LVLLDSGSKEMELKDAMKKPPVYHKEKWSDLIGFSTLNNSGSVSIVSDTPENNGFANNIIDANIAFEYEKRGNFKAEPDEAKADDTAVTQYKLTYKLQGDNRVHTITYMIQSDAAPTLNPEPSTVTLLGAGSLALLAYGRRRLLRAAT
jgi:hypothetical protein